MLSGNPQGNLHPTVLKTSDIFNACTFKEKERWGLRRMRDDEIFFSTFTSHWCTYSRAIKHLRLCKLWWPIQIWQIKRLVGTYWYTFQVFEHTILRIQPTVAWNPEQEEAAECINHKYREHFRFKYQQTVLMVNNLLDKYKRNKHFTKNIVTCWCVVLFF